jgi:hypothetical protein
MQLQLIRLHQGLLTLIFELGWLDLTKLRLSLSLIEFFFSEVRQVPLPIQT